jgi:hypothetical protein
MNTIEVTYLCWGCGSQLTRYEPQVEPIPAKEIWNVCLDCRKHSKGIKTLPQNSVGMNDST